MSYREREIQKGDVQCCTFTTYGTSAASVDTANYLPTTYIRNIGDFGKG